MCFISPSASGSFLSGWREHRRLGSAMHTGLSASRAQGIATSSSERRAPRGNRRNGIPNFDDCRRYCSTDFPYRHYVLACTSPLRELFRLEDRKAFIRRAVELACRRRPIFKLHPNENIERTTREIDRHAPGAIVFATGSAEEMTANCNVLITRFSSTAFVGLALGKETYSDFDMDELRRLVPVQNGSAAFSIANVCRRLLDVAPL